MSAIYSRFLYNKTQIIEPFVRKNIFCICENKGADQLHSNAQISCTVTTQMNCAFVFATQIVQSLYFPNLKFQASNHLLLYSLVCVRHGWKPEDRFSCHCHAAQFMEAKYDKTDVLSTYIRYDTIMHIRLFFRVIFFFLPGSKLNNHFT